MGRPRGAVRRSYNARVMMYDLPEKTKAYVLAGVTLGMLFNTMNFTLITPAIPDMLGDLDGLELFSWIFTAPMLTSIIAIPVVGRLSDVYGRGPFLIGGIVIYVAAALFSGAAQDMTQLIVSRGIAGIGQGATAATAFAIIADLFPPAERGKWIGLNSAAIAVAGAVGPLLGGVLTDNLSWRWVFFANVPLGLLTIGLLLGRVPSRRLQVTPRIDFGGIALLTGALVPFLLAISWGGSQHPWGSPTVLGLFGAAVVVAAAFFLQERRAPEPLVELELFGNRGFRGSAIIALVHGFPIWAGMLFTPLFVQVVLGHSASASGTLMLPMIMGVVVGGFAGGQIVARTGRYHTIGLGGSVVLAGSYFLLATLGPESGLITLVWLMVLAGVGTGVVMPVYMIFAQNVMPVAVLGAVTAMTGFCRNIGGAIGVAVVGTALNARLASRIEGLTPPEVAAAVPAETLDRFQDPQTLLDDGALAEIEAAFGALGADGPGLFQSMLDNMTLALSDAITLTYLLSAFVALAGVAVGVALSRTRVAAEAEDVGSGAESR